MPGKSSVSSTLPLVCGRTLEGVRGCVAQQVGCGKNRSPHLVGHPDLKAVFKLYKSRTGL